MKTLLAVIDNPDRSDDFMRYTARMAEDLNLNLYFLHIQNPRVYPLSSGATGAAALQYENTMEVDRENALGILETRVKELLSQMPIVITVNYGAEIGSRNMIIDQYISDNRADMVVLEAEYKTDFWSLGSSNMDVIIQGDCPVWIIPRGIDYEQYEKIVYATDYNEADIPTLSRLIELTRRFSPEIIAFHVTESEDFEEETRQKGFEEILMKETSYEKTRIRTKVEKEEGDFGEFVNEFALRMDADMIVLLKENRNFFERLFKSSSTIKVITEARLPVLVFQEK